MCAKKKVFISYHTEEKKLAESLQDQLKELEPFRALKESEENVFVGGISLNRGVKWFTEIREQIEGCDYFIVVASPTSIERHWLAFECGAAQASKMKEKEKKLIVLCHSGMTEDDLPKYLKCNDWIKIDVAEEKFRNKINEELGIDEANNIAEDTIVTQVVELNKLTDHVTEQNCFNVALTRNSKNIEVKNIDPDWEPTEHQKENNKKATEDFIDTVCPSKDFNIRRSVLTGMQQFLKDETETKSVDTGVAIGIQNVLWYSGRKYKSMPKLFVGVRRKSTVDPTNSGLTLSKGLFNTGYKLLRGLDTLERAQSMEALEDLFRTQSIKRLVTGNTTPKRNKEVFDHVNNRLKLFGSRLFNLKLPEGEVCHASIFINNSAWYPRYEIGIWKYVEITDKDIDAMQDEPLAGFGEDLFQDYRGKFEADSNEINYWIWVSSGRVYFRSYPEDRFIPRKKPVGSRRHQHSVLVSSDVLEKKYGVTDRYTPFANDEELKKNIDSIVPTQFSSPARRLLTWF